MTAAEPPSPYGLVIEGAGGVVFNRRGEVLVIQHRNGTWVFPKGHLEPGETHLAAALREVEEEAGIPARCPDPKRRRSTRYVNDRGQKRHITYYRLETDASEPVMRERTFPNGAFLPCERAAEQLSYPEDRTLLQELR